MKFGTDGLRGRAGVELTPDIAFKLGFAAATVLIPDNAARASSAFLVSKDPRLSSDMLEAALCSGILCSGANVTASGIVSTPAVPYLLKTDGFSGGFMITASHNPIGDNGIKVFGADGFKIPSDIEKQIESKLNKRLEGIENIAPRFGAMSIDPNLHRKYLKFLKREFAYFVGRVPKIETECIKVVFDCAHGAVSELCREVFGGVMPEAEFINANFNGSLINMECGSTDLSLVAREVKRTHANFGMAFDGDGDRVLIVDGKGREIDGDKILGALAVNMNVYSSTGGVVATVMSNFGLEEFLAKHGIELHRVPVGDKYVLQGLIERGLILGGEQSGHIVMLDRSIAGDGLLTAAAIIGLVARTGRTIEELTSEIKRYPQHLVNIEVHRKSGWENDTAVQSDLKLLNERIAKSGRLLVRPSGTEPLIRVMTESKSSTMAKTVVEEASQIIRDWDERNGRGTLS